MPPTMPTTPTTSIMDKRVTGNSTAVSCAKNEVSIFKVLKSYSLNGHTQTHTDTSTDRQYGNIKRKIEKRIIHTGS